MNGTIFIFKIAKKRSGINLVLGVDSVAQCHTLFYGWETKEIKSSSPIPDKGLSPSGK